MAKILLQSTIAADPNDWDITRFSLLADELRSAGHQVTARNRADGVEQDPILSQLDQLDFDQLWLIAVDVGNGLTDAEAAAIRAFRDNGGGVLTARDHQDLGSCLEKLGSLGELNQFHDNTPDADSLRDDQDTPTISWPNYHSGANGDYQPVLVDGPVHELLGTTSTSSGRIEWFPAHPHEGSVRAAGPHATALAQGRSTVTGRQFNLSVALDGEHTPDGRSMGPAVAESTFHHFANYNWDLDLGCPSFVSEPPGSEIKADPSRLAVFKQYVHNIATWLGSNPERSPQN
jgi:hypothetical protein